MVQDEDSERQGVREIINYGGHKDSRTQKFRERRIQRDRDSWRQGSKEIRVQRDKDSER